MNKALLMTPLCIMVSLTSSFADSASTRSTWSTLDVTAPPFGARCDGTADDYNALQTALDTGQTIILPGEGRICVTQHSLKIRSNQNIITNKGRTVLRLNGLQAVTLLDLSQTQNVSVVGLTLDGSFTDATPRSTVEAFIVLRDTVGSTLDDLIIQNAPGTNGIGAITLSGSTMNNTISRTKILHARGSDIVLSGRRVSGNSIFRNNLLESGFWGVYLGQGASMNVISENLCINGDGVAKFHSAECYAETVHSDHNAIVNNVSEGAGDDGISVSGSYTTVTGNKISGSYYSGINIWGSNNNILENIIEKNGQSGLSPIACVGVNGYFGGAGQNNTIADNKCMDSQPVPTQLGIILTEQNYAIWRPEMKVRVGQYVLYNLRIYQAASEGTTGFAPPVHDEGAVRDGEVLWAFTNTFVGKPEVVGNIVRHNRINGFKGQHPYVAPNNWSENSLIR